MEFKYLNHFFSPSASKKCLLISVFTAFHLPTCISLLLLLSLMSAIFSLPEKKYVYIILFFPVYLQHYQVIIYSQACDWKQCLGTLLVVYLQDRVLVLTFNSPFGKIKKLNRFCHSLKIKCVVFSPRENVFHSPCLIVIVCIDKFYSL